MEDSEDQRQRDSKELEAILLERLDSGLSVEMDDADFERIRKKAAERIDAVQSHQRGPRCPDRAESAICGAIIAVLTGIGTSCAGGRQSALMIWTVAGLCGVIGYVLLRLFGALRRFL